MGRPDRIPVTCPKCGTGLRAPLELAGKRAKCRVCGTKMTIPAFTPTPVPEAEVLSLEDEPVPLESVDDRPRPKKPRLRPIDDDDDRPRRSRSRTSKPVWPWIAGGSALVVLVLAVGGYLLFGRKSGPNGDPVTLANIAGDWACEIDGHTYRYSFNPQQRGYVSFVGHGQLTMMPIGYDVQTYRGVSTIIIMRGGEEIRIPASFDAEGRLVLEKSYRGEQSLVLQDLPAVLRKAEPIGDGTAVLPPPNDEPVAKSGGMPPPSGIQVPESSEETRNTRDLERLQGRWKPKKVWVGAEGSQTDLTVGLDSAILIEGRSFRQKGFEVADDVAEITGIDAAKKELVLTFEKPVSWATGVTSKTWKCKYILEPDRFVLLRAGPAVNFAEQRITLQEPLLNQNVDKGVRLDWCLRN